MLSRSGGKRHLPYPDGVYLGAYKGRFAGALLWPSSVRWAGRHGRREDEQRRHSRLLPACCQMSPPSLKSRDQERWWWAALPPVQGDGPQAFSCGESITCSPPSCGTAQPRRLHLWLGKPRLREACEDGPGSFLYTQVPSMFSWVVVMQSLATV